MTKSSLDMKMDVINNGDYSLTEEEITLLDMINSFEFRLSNNEQIRFQNLIDALFVKLVLDGSKRQTKLIDSNCWKLDDFADNVENAASQEYSGGAGDDLELIQRDNNKIIEQLRRKKEQLESKQEDEQNRNLDVERAVANFLEKLRSICFFEGCYVDSYLLKGLYKPSERSVVLFMNNMSKEENRVADVMYTYIHEMFYAYYMHYGIGLKSRVRELEDCMVEFGALAFLEELKEKNEKFKSIFEFAKQEAEGKRYKIGDLAACGFGKYVFDHCNCKTDWIAAYLEKLSKLDVDGSDVTMYKGCVYPFYPIMEHECLKLLARILFYQDELKVRFHHFDAFHSVAMRILVVDDKVGCLDDSLDCCEKKRGIKEEPKGCDSDLKTEQKVVMEIEIKECPPYVDCSKKKCKLCTIKRLMDDGIKSDGKKELFDGIGLNKEYFYWKEEKIECFYCPSLCGDFIDGKTTVPDFNAEDCYKTDNAFAEISRDSLNIQIVGVHDVRTALILLRKYKFDMIFCDFLLDKKDDGSNEREYANQLFTFLSHEYKEEINAEVKKSAKDEKKISRLKALNQFQHDILDNRGPLDKLWIMPITGFNQTFIQDLYRNQINLIGHKWNISNGADPITTPWQFLYHLNKFIELQLKSCVYTRDRLMTFLQYSGDDLRNRIKGMKDGSCFEEFQQFMGAEYANFMKRYGARKLIERDAALDGDNSNKSLFATYIAREFYNAPKYRIETELNRMMQSFYHWAANMFNDRYGHQKLRVAFEQMRVFIAYNKLEEEAEDSNKLLYYLRFLHAVIDSEFDCKKINDWLKCNIE